MKLLGVGAAETVTGSCHHLTISGQNFVIDCGLFQGRQEMEALNYEPFPFALDKINAVLLTHGHLDHVGRLPKLVREGYNGPIYATATTQKIAEIVLLDAAKIQLEDYERSLRKAQRSGNEKNVPPPLFTDKDVAQTIAAFKTIDFAKPFQLGDVTVTYTPAGHILGSGFISVQSSEGHVIFSGDLGNAESGVQADFQLPTACDAVLVETTYGNRTHRPLSETLEEFRSVIGASLKAGGKVLIPSFALERAQNILLHLRNLQKRGDIPKIPIYLDSPMASKMTQLYLQSKNEFLPEIAAELSSGVDPFEPDTLMYASSADESKKINDVDTQAIIIAGSGMMTGGRILHHLKHNLWRKETSLVVVGYQSEGTLGRLLVNGKKQVKIHGEEITVRASIHTIGGFSAHADQDDLLRWLQPTGQANVYMIHGEVSVMNDFGSVLSKAGRKAVMVQRGKTYDLKQALSAFAPVTVTQDGRGSVAYTE
ncbi:MAG: MBL fold metallo-hydrolase [Trueperaceae bacterium]